MAEDPGYTTVLGRNLCPWLKDSYTRLEEAYQDRNLAHGWLFAGAEGLGKINLALAFADRLLNPELIPLEEFDAALAGSAMRSRHEPSNHHPDLHWLFPDEGKRTITIDQIRAASQALTMTSMNGGSKVVIVEPADALTPGAANALLKTLEEPTDNTYLLLVSHQPGRLPATIRSRCQRLNVRAPSTESTLHWLAPINTDASTTDWHFLLALASGAPLRALALFEEEYHLKNKVLEDKFILISKNKLDPQTLADEWLKADLEFPLSWLAMRLQRSIQMRLAPRASNLITDLGPDNLHNAWRVLTLSNLFRYLEAAERLITQLGKGMNADLALRVLLLDFQPQRGR
jgi:DNA polymerase III subunit delta'